MADTFTPQQKQAALIKELSRYGRGDYSQVKNYLKLIAAKQNLELDEGGETVIFTPQELWDIVGTWCSEELGFSIGDRGDIAVRSLKVQGEIDKRVKIDSTATGARHDLILKQSENPIIPPGSVPNDPAGIIFQKALAIRNAQIKEIEGKFIGKLRSNLMSSDIFKNSDPRTRALMLQMVAAGNHNFRNLSEFVPDDLNNLFLAEAGNLEINKETHRLWAQTSKTDFPKIVALINQTVQEVYNGHEATYEKDMAIHRGATALAPSLSDVDWMVDQVAVYGTPKEKALLANAIRSEIMRVSKLGHVSGEDIISAAFTNSGLSKASISYLAPLSPYLEEIRLVETGKLLGGNLKDKKSHLLATSELATKLGVDLDSIWLTPQDLQAAQAAITAKYGVNTLVEAFGKTDDLAEMAQIKNLMGMMSDSVRYRAGLRAHPLLALQDAWAKTWNRPVVDGRFSILDPFSGITTRWSSFQTNIAINIHDWAINAVNSGSWFSGFAGHIGDFTEGFIKHNADWSSAGHFFFERKWGNILDWAAKKAGHESWAVAKTAFYKSIISTIEVGANKFAAGLGTKIATTLTGLLTSETGIGLAILAAQVIWETLKFGIDKIKKFFTDSEFRNKLLNWFPVTLGAGLVLAMSLPALFVSGIGAIGATLLMILSLALLSLVGLIILSSIVSFGVILAISIIWFVFISPTFNIDSGENFAQTVTNIVCDESGGNNVASCANCLVKYLSQCYGEGQMVSGTKIKNKGISCIISKVISSQSAAAIEASAVGYNWLQCVGFARAAAICAGGDLPGQAVASGYIRNQTPGYKFVSGGQWCQPGDFGILDGDIGHIFVVGSNNSSTITGIDANYVGDGVVSSNTPFPTNTVAGCLKKI